MSLLTHWNSPESDDSWDTCILGGQFLPGKVEVTCKVSRKVDVKKAKGQDGATMEDQGYEPADVDIVVTMWTQDDLDIWMAVLPTFHPRKKGGPREPLEIIHPSPNSLGVTQIYIKDISAPMPSAKDGWTVKLGAVEWFPAPKDVKKGAGAGGKKLVKSYDSTDRFGEDYYFDKEPEDPGADDSAAANLGELF